MNRIAFASGACLVLALSGCGANHTEAGRTATSFAQAVSEANGKRACELLSPQTVKTLQSNESHDCATTILDQDLPEPAALEKVEQQGRSAFVVTGSDTMFLSRFPDGWKIIGAGCTEQGDAPYDCIVSGG